MPRPILAIVSPSIPETPNPHTHVSLDKSVSRLSAALRASVVRIDTLGHAATPTAIAKARAEAARIPALLEAWDAEVVRSMEQSQ